MSTSVAHDHLVSLLVEHLKSNGFTRIKADLAPYQCPEKIIWKNTNKGHVPDVSGYLNDKFYIFEVEDAESINLEHTRDQFTLFGAYARQFDTTFVILVPKPAEEAARQQRNAANATSSPIWTC